MNRLLKPFLKLPNEFESIRTSLNKDNYKSVNLYFQDESRFGLMTHMGRCLTAKGVKPIVKYQHAFKNTYLYGAFSPIDGDAFIYEIEGTTSEIFFRYIEQLSLHRPDQLKIVVIDNAGFHSLQEFVMPDNIKLIRIPPYSPELNPCEKMWAFIKQSYKNKVFETMDILKNWLSDFINTNIHAEIVKSITHHPIYMDLIKAHFNV